MSEIRENNSYLGMNLDSIITQVKPGMWTYALNAQVAGFNGNSLTVQNEQGNDLCITFPVGYTVIGVYNIIEIETVIFWLVNQTTGASEIGKMLNKSCVYETVINAPCLNFNINNPILKAVHKVTNCSTEVYWTDGLNGRRWIDLQNLPYTQIIQSTDTDPCNVVTLPIIDCNKLEVQPNFAIPEISYTLVASEGNTVAGTYQFAFQYCNSLGDPYTSYYSVTNPIPVYDYFKVTPDFNYTTGKSIQIEVDNIDTTGIYQYFNIAVIKTINNISSVDLVGTYEIEGNTQKILYSGQSKAGIVLTPDDIFEKFPTYDVAQDLTTVQDVLVWDGLTTTERVSYQQIFNQVKVEWVSYIIPPSQKYYANELNVANVKGYMRDEVYPLDAVVILTNGYQSDRFPIPGRIAEPSDLEMVNNNDTQFSADVCTVPESKPRWQVYNTGSLLGYDPQYLQNVGDDCYEGPYQYGEMAYWESTETYPCDEAVWGDLAGNPIRHHKFPDSSISHHHDANGNIFPIGVRINLQDLYNTFATSALLTAEQKSKIAAIKIVRGDRANSKSIIAKGLLYNVGIYTKDNSTYYFPNYPYNDLRPDPFIQKGPYTVNAGTLVNSYVQSESTGGTETNLYTDTIAGNLLQNDGDILTADYKGTFGDSGYNKEIKLYFGNSLIFDSGSITAVNGETWEVNTTITRVTNSSVSASTKFTTIGAGINTSTTTVNTVNNLDLTQPQPLTLTGRTDQTLNSEGLPLVYQGDVVGSSEKLVYVPIPVTVTSNGDLDAFSSTASQNRYTFHSPDTSFYQPFLGNILKLESVEYGLAKSHFTQVKNHSKYKFPSLNSYLGSLVLGVIIGFVSGTYGVADNIFNGTAAFTAFTVFNDIIYKVLPRRNFCYQFNSVGNYTTPAILPNDTGNKIRQVDIAAYLISGLQGVGDTDPINNYQRESSVYLRTTNTLPVPSSVQGVPEDHSRFTLSDVGCDTSFFDNTISSYYGSIKVLYPDQYGQIYSYDIVDTGFQLLFNLTAPFDFTKPTADIFGGDTFINQFALKRKYPFFLDNRVNPQGSVIYPDDSDIFYDELGNVGYPKYWFSTDIQQGNGGNFNIGELFGVKVNNFDCKDGNFFYDSGKIYLFAYGIPNFFVESEVNVDMRQATNSREGDYYPHVSGDVPDDWVQETYVPISYDNTYNYNKTYSKQNIENVFTTLPVDFVPGESCLQQYPNKAIYSDIQQDVINYKKNNWLIYRPANYFDFPLNYGKLVTLEGIENRTVLARFENNSKLYNALLTINTSNPQAAYLGNSTLFKSAPPIDFAETDLGYIGTQNKFFLKTEYGNITTDAKRGQLFLLEGQRATDLGDAGLEQFLIDNLNFAMLDSFPDYDTDNNFKGVGMHGVYDNKYDRFIITKLDYRCLNENIIYNSATDTFTLNDVIINLGDPVYFCNVSFTLSYWFKTKSWISFHSYIPNYFVGAINVFYSGIPGTMWKHNTNISNYNNFYGSVHPYIIETPFAYKNQDEIIQSVSDYSKVDQIIDTQRFVSTNDIFFNKAVVYNDEENSGILNLIPKPTGNLQAYNQYPKYNTDSKDILFVKSGNFYNYNGFWNIVKDNAQPIWQPSCESTSILKDLDPTNLNYALSSYKKYPIRSKDCRIRHILDNRSDVRITSQFMLTETQLSYK